MKTWFFKRITAAKSLIAVICAVSLVATGITGCGSSQPDEANTVSSATGGGTKVTWLMRRSKRKPMYRKKRLTSFLILMLKKKSR